jgi:mono/diheme cytochrome c family protein
MKAFLKWGLGGALWVILGAPAVLQAAEATPPPPPLPPVPPLIARPTNRVATPPADRTYVSTPGTNAPLPGARSVNLPPGAIRPAVRTPITLTRPPATLARPPEVNYTPPPPDPTYIPGLTPSSALAGNSGRPLPPLRPGYTATPGISTLARTGIGVTPPQQESVFAWDGLVKEMNLKPGETSGRFAFAFTNTSPNEVTITYVRTSCGCTTAKVPPLPWKIPAGGQGSFEVVLDAKGKSGVVTKTVTIESSAGYRYLTVRVAVPAAAGAMAAAERARNLQVALDNRQAVLKGDCATCHVTPGIGKHGEELYDAVCGVCHEAEHRASMVPNLRALSRPLPAEEWRRIIRAGKKDSLMPAFAATEGGFMSDAQIESLVEYLTGPFRTSSPHPPGAVHLPAGAVVLPTE